MSTPPTRFGLSEFDFGLTWLATQFNVDWRYSGSTEDLLTRVLPVDHPAEMAVLQDDARRARAGLAAVSVEALWRASTGSFRFGPDGASPSGPAWLDAVLAATGRWTSEHPDRVAVTRSIPNPVDAVRSQIEAFAPLYRGKHDGPPAGDVIDALLACARACSADLALRFLLRITTESLVAVTPERYARLRRLGSGFGYGEYVVGDIEFLVEEPDDPDRKVGG